MPSLYLLESSSPRPSWLYMSNRAWGERYYYTRSLNQAEDTQVHGTKGRELTNDAIKLLWPLKHHGEQGKSSVNEKGKFLASLPKREAGRSWKLQAGMPHLGSWESYRGRIKKNQPTNQSQMEAISKLIKLIGNSQPKSAISKSSLTTLFAFSDEMTTSEWEQCTSSLSC